MWEKKSIIVFTQTSELHNLYQSDVKKHLYVKIFKVKEELKALFSLLEITKASRQSALKKKIKYSTLKAMKGNTTNSWLHLLH